MGLAHQDVIDRCGRCLKQISVEQYIGERFLDKSTRSYEPRYTAPHKSVVDSNRLP